MTWQTELHQDGGEWVATAHRPGLRLVARADTPDAASRALVILAGTHADADCVTRNQEMKGRT